MPTSHKRRRHGDVPTILPLLDRYACALTGDSAAGGVLVSRLRRAFAYDPDGPRFKTQMFRAFQQDWRRTAQGAVGDPSAELFLLHRFEGFALAELGHIFGMPEAEVFRLLSAGEEQDRAAPPNRIMVLEGDALMSMHICDDLAELGHRVVAIARTMPEAVFKSHSRRPSILISDRMLRDGTTGLAAVRAVAIHAAPTPAVFFNVPHPVTAEQVGGVPSFHLLTPFLPGDVDAVLRQARSFARYAAARDNR